MGQNSYTFDADLQLKDAGLIAASAAAQVGGQAKVLNLGKGRVHAIAKIQVTAIEVQTDEKYELELQFSDSPTFASGIVTGPTLKLGHTTVVPGNSANSVIGEYELPFTNELNGTRYQYCRLFTRIAGTIATGINYFAFVAGRPASS